MINGLASRRDIVVAGVAGPRRLGVVKPDTVPCRCEMARFAA